MTVPQDLLDAFSRVPINRHLKLTLAARAPDGCVVALDPLPEHLQEEGVVQGGVLTAVADTAAVYCFHPDLDPATTMTSIELKINFLAPALVGRGPIEACSRLVRKGRRIGVCDVDVRQAGRLVARGIFTYLFYERRAGA
ncbi:MAG TPA: PaaI family thioesterase [Candidatus Polarisedimenticolia bacterium]|nr:PaaI family thioesterase [Candidatus Polarisedimenticolia bacterium]